MLLSHVFTRFVLQGTSFDFSGLALTLAGISLGGIGMILAGYFLFPETAEKYKRQIPLVIVGLVLVALAPTIIGALGG